MVEKETDQASSDQKKTQITGLMGRIPRLFNYILSKFSPKIRQLLYKTSGISAIIIMVTIPVIVYSVSHLVKYTQNTDKEISNFEIPFIIGKNIARLYNPGKTWSEQEAYLYSVSAQTYNDESYDSDKVMKFSSDGVIKAGGVRKTATINGLFDLYTDYNSDGRRLNSSSFIENDKMFVDRPPFENFVYNEANDSVSYTKYEKIGSGTGAYSVSKYKKNEKLLKLSFTSDSKIKVECPELKRSAEVTLPRNDVDIIIAIPTNRASNTTSNDNTADFKDYSNQSNADATPIRQIAKACQVFLMPFLHTAGVAVGIVPYSGKVSLSPYVSDDMVIEAQLNNNPVDNNPEKGLIYVAQSMFYGSDGKAGGDIVLRKDDDESLAYGDYIGWGSEEYGRPIMARRGQLALRREMYLNSGAITDKTGSNSLLLDMTTSPLSGSDEYKFMQMNTNPCYLGFCNTLAMLCEKDCPTYRANPYFMTELTSDIQGLIYDLELFVPFKDERNKSNFLFLPVVMAGNLFSWGSHPSELSSSGRVREESRQNKARMVVIIANAPDNFEPQEMTYLGFNNDYSEIPMIESDTIVFDKENKGYAYDDGKFTGTKGIVSFKTQYGGIDEEKGGYLFQENEAPEVTARISFPNKALVRVVTERVIPATVIVYGDNGVEDNVSNSPHEFWGGTKTLSFRGPQQVLDYSDLGTSFQSGNYTTKGPNFGHNLSTKKVKIKFFKCKLTDSLLKNQILRFYGVYSNENGKSMIANNSGCVWSGAPSNMKSRIDPCIDSSSNFSSDDDMDTVNYHLKSGWTFHSTRDKYPDAYGKTVSFKGNCFERINWRGSDSTYGTQYVNVGMIDDCESCSHSELEEGVSSYCSSSLPSGYFIASYDFNPICYGVGNLKKFVCAVDHFQGSDPAVITDKAAIKVGSTSRSIGDIYYYTGSGTKYRSYDTSSAGTASGGTDYVQMLMGKFNIESYYYYKEFASKKSRSRTVKQTIDTYRTFPSARVSGPPKLNDETCCSEIWEYDPCYGCPDRYYPRYYSHCVNVGIRYGGTRHLKNILKYGTGEYWCGRREGSWDEGPGGQVIGSTIKTATCTNDPGDDMSESDSDDFVFTKTCSSAVCSVTGENCKGQIFNTGRYNTSIDCSGVCWQHYLSSSPGWSVSSSKSLECKPTYTPSTKYTAVFTKSQQQESISCTFSEGENINSKCEYPDISEPIVNDPTFGYVKFNCSGSSCGSCLTSEYGGLNRTGVKWTETSTETKKLGAMYYREPNGGYRVVYDVDGSTVEPGSSPYLTYSPDIERSGTQDASKTQTGIYRYNLHNFFFVSGDEKKTEYAYSDRTLTSKISSASDSNLLNNSGTYLLPVNGEEDTYWVCFCGDADLDLNFEDATDSSVQFSNIDPIEYNVDLENSGEVNTTSGVEVNYIEKKRIFYIHPNQLKDNLDDDGNYYVDLKITGKTRILSVEVTNRPLTSGITASTVEIVGKDSSGGKIVGNTNTDVEFRLNAAMNFSFKAKPTGFWIDGKKDFRQTSGTARICGTSRDFSTTVKASVPDSGSGKITIEPNGSGGSYKLYSDRKIKSINVPVLPGVTPKVEFSGDVTSKSHTFSDTNQKTFEWPSSSMSHASASLPSSFRDQTFSGTQKNLNFELTNCELISAEIKNMNMRISPTINDFPSVRIYAENNDVRISEYYTDDFIGFLENGSNAYVNINMEETYKTYGSGIIGATGWFLYGKKGYVTIGRTLKELWGGEFGSGLVECTGACNSETTAKIVAYSEPEQTANNKKRAEMSLRDIYYQVASYDLLNNSTTYSTQDTSKHNYAGTMSFHGVGDIKIVVEPKNTSTSTSTANFTKNMSESELTTNVFGNYVYTFSTGGRALDCDADLTLANNSFVLLYGDGKIGSTTILQGGSVDYSVTPSSSAGGYYYTNVSVINAELSLSSSTIGYVGSKTLNSSDGEQTINISSDDYAFELQSDGYYHVKIPCRNVYVSDAKAGTVSTLYYAHPNIISDDLKNSRIIDGYDQATYQRMKLYGKMNYDGRSDLPVVSPMHHLYYNPKDGSSSKYIYPQLGVGRAALGEEGDFFIQLWDPDDKTPSIQWKIGDSIKDADVNNTGFGSFKSNYIFSGLHRMFFPYEVYNKDYAGYSKGFRSAQVFVGYTQPVNYILHNNGYQQTYSLSSGRVSDYTKPNTALENLAKDACTKLKTDLATSKGAPMVFLVKYKTNNATLSLESCADYTYSANNEEDLLKVMRQISLGIEEISRTNELQVHGSDSVI